MKQNPGASNDHNELRRPRTGWVQERGTLVKLGFPQDEPDGKSSSTGVQQKTREGEAGHEEMMVGRMRNRGDRTEEWLS